MHYFKQNLLLTDSVVVKKDLEEKEGLVEDLDLEEIMMTETEMNLGGKIKVI